MTDTGPGVRKPDHGMEREHLGKVLAEAEPRRRAALGASLCVTAATAATFWLLFAAGGAGALVPALGACFIAGLAWALCNRLWREKAIGAIAPALGARWGQQSFSGGRFSDGLAAYIARRFSHDGNRIIAWRGAGVYRGIRYEVLEETTTTRRGLPRESGGVRTRHALIAEIDVPRPFSGSVELHERRGAVSTRIDDLLRVVAGEAAGPVSVNPAFDAVFETVASPDASVDTLLTPAFQQAMMALAAHQGRVFIGRFENGRFTLRLRIHRLVFASAHLLKPMPRLEEEADALWWDLTLPHRLIDVLSGEQEGPLR